MLALVVSGATIVASGALHLYLWGRADGYRAVPTIGPLFLAQGAAGLLLGVALVAARRTVVTLAGAVFMALSIGGLVVSVNGELFGYPETLDAPYVKMALGIEIAGLIVCLATCLHQAMTKQPTR